MFIYSFFRFFSHIGYYRILSLVPCDTRYILVDIYFLYNSVYMLILNSEFILSAISINAWLNYDI